MLIVIEGLDGAGKSTQVNLLRKHYEQEGIYTFFLHFPRFDTPVFGEMIASFLRGDYGNVDEINPELVALLYAGDRKDAATLIEEQLKKGIVILDRYVYSNVAFQCAKLFDVQKRKELREKIIFMEYNYFNIPKPDINIFLDVPFDFTAHKLSEERTGDDRDYLKGKRDIHEADLNLQQRVRNVYLEQTSESNFLVINCADGKQMKSPDIIHKEILEIIAKV